MNIPIGRLIRPLLSSFLLLSIVRRQKSRFSSMKIKAAQVYVLGVKKTRIFFLGALCVLVSFVFLTNGLFLIQEAFFSYSTWSMEKKFVVALSLGGIEILVAIGIFIYLFREETWGKFFGIHKVINCVIDKDSKNNKA